MTEREKEIKKICSDVLATSPVENNAGGTYCPFCHEGEEDGQYLEMDDIKHENDCAYIIAQRFKEEEKELKKPQPPYYEFWEEGFNLVTDTHIINFKKEGATVNKKEQ